MAEIRHIVRLVKPTCPLCQGRHFRGNELEPPDDDCTFCGGCGHVWRWRWLWWRVLRRVAFPLEVMIYRALRIECPTCRGDGRNPDFVGPLTFENRHLSDCPQCGHVGWVWAWRRLWTMLLPTDKGNGRRT